MADLLALAERCERAVFPAPDDAVAHELVEIRSAICHLMFGHGYDAYSPDYVGSLDAAMTLVPERSWLRMDEWPPDFCRPVASIQPIRDPQVPSHVAIGSTLGLALCAAALRARHAIESAVPKDIAQ